MIVDIEWRLQRCEQPEVLIVIVCIACLSPCLGWGGELLVNKAFFAAKGGILLMREGATAGVYQRSQ